MGQISAAISPQTGSALGGIQHFSAQATDFVTRIPQRVILINGKRLTELMVEHGVGVRTSQTVEFKRLDEDFFSEE